MQHPRTIMRKASSAALLLAMLAAAAASVSARSSKQLLGDYHDQASSMASATPLSIPGILDSKFAVITSMLPAKLDSLDALDVHHKQHLKHEGKSSHLPLAIHMDQYIPMAVNPNPSNPPMILPNPGQPPMVLPVLPAVDAKLTKLSKFDKKAMKAAAKLAAAAHVKFDHDKKDKHDKFDHHADLPVLQMPALSMPNPSQRLMMTPAADVQHTKLSKHANKAMKAAAKLAAAAGLKFSHHDKKVKHDKFDQELPAGLVNPNPSNPPNILANPSQPPMMPPVLPAADVKHSMLSKHEMKALKAAQLAAAAGVRFDHVAGVSMADVVMRNEPRFEGPTLLG